MEEREVKEIVKFSVAVIRQLRFLKTAGLILVVAVCWLAYIVGRDMRALETKLEPVWKDHRDLQYDVGDAKLRIKALEAERYIIEIQGVDEWGDDVVEALAKRLQTVAPTPEELPTPPPKPVDKGA